MPFGFRSGGDAFSTEVVEDLNRFNNHDSISVPKTIWSRDSGLELWSLVFGFHFKHPQFYTTIFIILCVCDNVTETLG